jgi:hypothetical protein
MDLRLIIHKNFVYLETGGRKRIDGNYVDVVETYDRAPRGTGEVFRKILDRIK